jgi:guanylate kinase
MNWRGINITGTSGAGKSTLTAMLRARHPEFEQVKAVTTRAAREGDEPGTYEHHTPESFEQIRGGLVIWAEYRGQHYGITSAHLAEVEGRGKVPLMVITPRSLAEYLAREPGGRPFLVVFIDAPDVELDFRLGIRDGSEKKASVAEQRAEDRRYSAICHVVIQNLHLDSSSDRLREGWNQGINREAR